MSIILLKKGLLDTIQDNGRFGYQHSGINPGGCMDFIAAKVANILVYNNAGEPVIEMHFPAAVFSFQHDCIIAITGADFEPRINKEKVPLNTTILVSKDSVLQFTALKTGARAYLAIGGKWNIKPWLNSFSTNLKAVAGGYNGRALMKGDIIDIEYTKVQLKVHTNTIVLLPVQAHISSVQSDVIKCIAGSEYYYLRDDHKHFFNSNSFQITPRSDRMGYRLHGINMECEVKKECISSAVVKGTVQLIPSGQLIILMADHQTTGGYPKIANVISADFSKLAQYKPNESIRFKMVELMVAEAECIKQHEHMQELVQDIKSHLEPFIVHA